MSAPRDRSLPVLAVFSTTGVLVQGVARFLYSLLIGRVLGAAVLGVVNPAISVAMLASILLPSATGSAATKFMARSHGAGRPEDAAAVEAHLARRVLAAAVVLAPASAVVSLLVLHTSGWTAASVAWLTAAYSGYLFVRGVQFGTKRVGRATVWEVGSALTSIVLLAVVLFRHSPGWLLVPMCVGYTAYAALGWPRLRGAGPDKALRREMDAFTGWAVMGNLASAGLLQLSLVLAGASDTALKAGIYAAAVALATPASLLSRSLSLVLIPSMASAVGRGDTRGLRTQLDLVTRGLVVVMVAVFGSLALCAHVLLSFFGPAFTDGTPLLRLLLAAVLLSTVSVGAVNGLTSGASEGIRLSALSSSVGFVLGLVIMVVATVAGGVLVVAVGYLAGTAVTALVPMVIMARRGGVHWWGLVLRGALGVAAVCVLLLLTRGDTSILAAAVTTVVFLLAWAGLNRTEVIRLASARTRVAK